MSYDLNDGNDGSYFTIYTVVTATTENATAAIEQFRLRNKKSQSKNLSIIQLEAKQGREVSGSSDECLILAVGCERSGWIE